MRSVRQVHAHIAGGPFATQYCWAVMRLLEECARMAGAGIRMCRVFYGIAGAGVNSDAGAAGAAAEDVDRTKGGAGADAAGHGCHMVAPWS